MNRILVVRGGAIGDFILTLPALKVLRQGFPHSRIEILGYKHIIALAENRFYADAARSIEYAPLASFFAKAADLPTELADYFHSFDLVISYLFDPDRIFEQNVLRCGVENFLACSPKITGHEHAALQLARPLEQLGLSNGSAAAELFPSSADQADAALMLQSHVRPVIAVHPGSGSPLKNWPADKWNALVDWLLRSEVAGSVLVVGGEADQDAVRSLRTMSVARVFFAENLPLPQLAAILQRSAFFIGHDSGISHLAAAVNTPSVLLFGPTDPLIWAPANADTRVLVSKTGKLDDLPLEEVIAAVSAAARVQTTS